MSIRLGRDPTAYGTWQTNGNWRGSWHRLPTTQMLLCSPTCFTGNGPQQANQEGRNGKIATPNKQQNMQLRNQPRLAPNMRKLWPRTTPKKLPDGERAPSQPLAHYATLARYQAKSGHWRMGFRLGAPRFRDPAGLASKFAAQPGPEDSSLG